MSPDSLLHPCPAQHCPCRQGPAFSPGSCWKEHGLLRPPVFYNLVKNSNGVLSESQQGWSDFWSPCLFTAPFYLFFFFFFLGPNLQYMEVPRLGVESELSLPVYATAMRDPSHVCELHHSSWQCWNPNPLREARDRTHILMDTSLDLFPLLHEGNSPFIFLLVTVKETVMLFSKSC